MQVQNPIMMIDMPDPDVIRVEDTYYMVSTTMFVMPGGPILKSKDLVHWEIVSYIFDIIEDNEMYRLENGKHAYGKGQWATSLAYYRGRFYASFVCHNMKRTYIYHTEDIEKSGWDRYVLDGVYHDMAFLFDEDKAYFIYNCGEISIVELKDDLSGLKEGGINRLLFSAPSENIKLRCEGCRAYKRNGYYYLLFIEWPIDGNQRRRVVCYRSRDLFGSYERKILLDDDMGHQNKGIAQGALLDDTKGAWYSILFQDYGAVGRIPYLMPVTWVDDWPMLGFEGKVPPSFETLFQTTKSKALIVSDSFCHSENQLALQWEWNHNPNSTCWSFKERPGYLRLHTSTTAKDILAARNTLTQKTSGPRCVFTVELEHRNLKLGDYAGLAAFQGNYGTVGIKAELCGARRVLVCKKDDYGHQYEEDSAEVSGDRIFLKVAFDFYNSRDVASFYFSEDGSRWIKIGKDLSLRFTLDLFIGCRIGIFCYCTIEAGGYADFRNFYYAPEV